MHAMYMMHINYVPLQTHLPGYVEKADELKAKGVELIACIAVNDPFVMEAWGKAHNTDGKASPLNNLLGSLPAALRAAQSTSN